MGVAYGLAVAAKKQLALRGFDVESRNLDAWLKTFQKAVCSHRVNINSVDNGTILDAIHCVSAHVDIHGLVFVCLSVRFCASLVIAASLKHDAAVHPSVIACVHESQTSCDIGRLIQDVALSLERHLQTAVDEPHLHPSRRMFPLLAVGAAEGCRQMSFIHHGI